MRVLWLFPLLLPLPSRAGEPIVSGPQIGERPGPYAFTVATGPQRGQSFCYICDTADKPAIVFFATKPSDGLGKLIAAIDAKVAAGKGEVRSWATFLGDKNDPDMLADWSKQHGLRAVPVGVFDDPEGPPSYKLDKAAEVTIILFVKAKVTGNFALRGDEINAKTIAAVEKALTTITPSKK